MKVSELEQIIKSLKTVIEEQAAKIAGLENLVKIQQEQILTMRRKQFGSSSEQTPGQLLIDSLFNEAEDQADASLPEPAIEQITYERKKPVGKRKEDLKDLPVERVSYELSEEERICQKCNEVMEDIGATVRDFLKIIPAQVIHVQEKIHAYACKNGCEDENNKEIIARAEAPAPLIVNSLATPSAVAHIAVQKYVNGVPLYRIEKGLSYDGVTLSRQVMANWIIYCSQNYLVGLYMLLTAHLLRQDICHADETTTQVLKEPGRDATTKSHEWVYRSGRCSPHPVVIYNYQETREHRHPKEFLKGFSGYLHTDGYEAYHNLPPGIIVVGCHAHARRYWFDAYEAVAKDKRDGSIAERGLVYFNLLFAFEDEFRDSTPDERYKKRLEYSKPLLEDYYNWITSLSALPKSLLGKAIHYSLSQREYLENFFLDGRLEISNNAAERSVRPYVSGRKQWLFSDTPAGAESSSVFYSIIETAKENSLNPFEYVKYLLEKLPSAKSSELDSFLPWSDSLPDKCRTPHKTPNSNGKRKKHHYNSTGSLHRALYQLRKKYCDNSNQQPESIDGIGVHD